MSQMNSGMSAPVKPQNNVYTMLMLATIVALAVGIGVLWLKNTELTGESNPFLILPESSATR